MPMMPSAMSQSTADAICHRALRDLRYLNSAYDGYCNNRAKTRENLVRRLERLSTMGMQADKQRRMIEAALVQMDAEDAEEANPDTLVQYPRSPLCQRPAYRMLSYRMAITAGEDRVAKAQADREQVLAEYEVARAIHEGNGSDAGGPGSEGSIRSSSRPPMRPIHIRIDSKLGSMLGTRGLERHVRPRSEDLVPQVNDGGERKWFSKWGFHGVGASKFEWRPSGGGTQA